MILMMMLPSIMKIGILLDFTINQDFIARVLCIRKDEPAVGCNGKCHLKKKLEEVSEPNQEKAPNHKVNRIKLIDDYITTSFLYEVKESVYVSRLVSAHKDSLYFLSLTADIFHPPQHSLL
jgi:hypothetical protein